MGIDLLSSMKADIDDRPLLVELSPTEGCLEIHHNRRILAKIAALTVEMRH